MHWVESAIYFSAAPLLAMVAPLYMFRLMSLSLIVFPLEGTAGAACRILQKKRTEILFGKDTGDSVTGRLRVPTTITFTTQSSIGTMAVASCGTT